MHDDLLLRHKAVMPSWLSVYYDHPISIVSGKGCEVTDGEGHTYLDLFGGILTTMVGHSLDEVVDAIAQQARQVIHTSTLYLSEPMVRLAERIATLSNIPDARVFFTTSGTEANDAALLLATSYRRSNQVLAMRNSYHGRSFTAMAITGNRSWSSSSLSGLAVSFVHGGYRLRSPFRDLSDADFTAACVQDLRDVLDMTTSGDVACMIAEPIQGVGGFTVPPDGFFGAMKDVLDESGILFISDEVQTGWGRTGRNFWGYEAHGFVPDMLTFAKGVANGMPLGGVIARAEVMDAMGANSISTFGGNPVSVAASEATLDYLFSHDLQANCATVGALMRTRLDALGATYPFVAEVRGEGMMLAIEFCKPGGIEPDAALAGAVLETARANGVLIGKGGLYGNVLRITPPLTLSAEEAGRAMDAVEAAFAEVAGQA